MQIERPGVYPLHLCHPSECKYYNEDLQSAAILSDFIGRWIACACATKIHSLGCDWVGCWSNPNAPPRHAGGFPLALEGFPFLLEVSKLGLKYSAHEFEAPLKTFFFFFFFCMLAVATWLHVLLSSAFCCTPQGAVCVCLLHFLDPRFTILVGRLPRFRQQRLRVHVITKARSGEH